MALLAFVSTPAGPFCLAALGVVVFFVIRRFDPDVQESPRPDMYDGTWTRLSRAFGRRA